MKIFFGVIIIVVFLYLWPSALGGDTEFLIVQGESMFPTIQPGSLVITKKAPPYDIGEIVSYPLKSGSVTQIVVHRIISEDPRGFIIQGDNNAKPDKGFTKEDDIFGRVIFATPYAGDLLGMAKNPIVLVSLAVAISVIQTGQKRLKKRREKLRRIRLGLPKPPTLTLEEKNKLNQKKPDYTLFYGAIGFNVLIFAVIQIALSYGGEINGDMLTAFFYRFFEPTLASTLIFALYFVYIFSIYLLAKKYEKKFYKRKTKMIKKKSTVQLLIGQNFIPMVYVAHFLWLMFILLSVFHLLTLGEELIFRMSCDPTQNLACR